MAGFANARVLAQAETDGKYLYASYRKQPTQVTGAGVWFDLSMSPGNPAPNYYIGDQNAFEAMKASTHGGLRHGVNVNQLGYKKYLRKLLIQSASVGTVPLALLDYLGFYGFIDESDLDVQSMDNSVSLPRYTSGAGVQLMPVVVASHATGGQPFTVNYTNQDGVANRTTQSVLMGTQVVNGTILHSIQAGATYANNGPFLPLQIGDTGVRSVQSVTVGGTGDVGLFALVMVKVLASTCIFETTAAVEKDFLLDGPSMPEIVDDAYLNFIALPAGSLANAPIIGILETTWS